MRTLAMPPSTLRTQPRPLIRRAFSAEREQSIRDALRFQCRMGLTPAGLSCTDITSGRRFNIAPSGAMVRLETVGGLVEALDAAGWDERRLRATYRRLSLYLRRYDGAFVTRPVDLVALPAVTRRFIEALGILFSLANGAR
jgi:hypothetical protein